MKLPWMKLPWMKALLTLVRQDALVSWRNRLVLVTGITLAAIVTLYWTLPLMLPGELELGGAQLYFDGTADGSVRRHLVGAGVSQDLFVASREELVARAGESAGVTGVAVSGSAEALAFELIYGHLPAVKAVNILQAAMRSLAAAVGGAPFGAPLSVETLRAGAAPIAANQSLIAVMLAFEVMILGFLFVAVVVFGEKQQGSMLAYRVTPAGLTVYVVAKTLVFTLMSTLYGLVMVAATLGPGANLPALAPVLLLGCALMTVLGLGIAVFFNNLSEWFVPGVLVLAINMLSIVPYQIPTFRGRWLQYLPGYSVIFGVTELLFPTGNAGFAAPLYATLGVWLVGAAVFAVWAVRRKVMREA